MLLCYCKSAQLCISVKFISVLGFQGQAKEIPGDRRPPDWPEELRSPEGQAFLWHRQV